MNRLSRLAVVLLCTALLSAAGCAGSRTQESTGEFIDDSWITTKVKATLVDSANVKATEISVETFKGAVQLSGFVSTQLAMNEAVRLTRGIKGVTSVKNDLRVK